uniref:protein GLUTAMINE DUMPER 2-like n=1 Tax=Erigeron canadensis TaxID=72917 RepID=UPI001CB8A03F|nr:protein GLUTAMINE DUMPER 2-like [Erigeron canadensis]
MTTQSTSLMAPSSPVTIQRSPWHSPVPYLFGGLAAMLGLIAFALLILACSYWKLSGDVERDLEAGQGEGDGDTKPVSHKESHVFEEKYLVIMAGQVNPTFLATPISSRTSSFGSCSCQSDSTMSTETSSVSDEEKQRSRDQIQVPIDENHDTPHQLP